MGSNEPPSLGDLGVDYAWLQEQLAELSKQLNTVGLEDEFEDEYEEWEDPSGGLLSEVFEACENDEADKLGPLLDKLKDTQWGIDTSGPDGDTPLHTAALYGSAACVQLLLARGASVTALNSEDQTTALHDAAAGGYTLIMRHLVDAARRGGVGGVADAQEGAKGEGSAEEGSSKPAAGGGGGAAGEDGAGEAGGSGSAADGPAAGAVAAEGELDDYVNAQDSEGETALHNAARGGHVEAVRFLLSLGADPLIEANDGSLPVDEAEDEGVALILQEAMDAADGEGAEGQAEEGAGKTEAAAAGGAGGK